MRYEQRRFPWVWALLGLLLGASGGLYYAWYLDPVDLINVAPHQLNEAARAEYIDLVAEAYLGDQNLNAARSRLEWVGIAEPGPIIAARADRLYETGGTGRTIEALAALASALGEAPQAADIFSPTLAVRPATGSPTPTFEFIPSPTPSPVPTSVPTSAPAPPTPTVVIIPDGAFDLVSLTTTCPEENGGRLDVYVTDEFGTGIPGVLIEVAGEGSRDQFFTGLQRDIDPGYADFLMAPDQTYTVTLAGLSEPVLGIDSGICQADSGAFSRPNYQLIFRPGTPETED